MIIWQVATEGRLRLATEQARRSPACKWESMGFEQVLVTSGSMNVYNSAFFSSSVPFPFPCAQLP